ncbi:MAG TPA: hypothetical protein VF047_00510 [Nitrososphaeraceae archaeon]
MVEEVVDSFLLIIITGLSMMGGIIFGLYYTKIISFFVFDLKKRRNQSDNSTTKGQEKAQELENALKTKPDLIQKNSELMEDELKIYQFEKDLATHAIEKILLASKNKSIDYFEKDRLLLKYKDQLKKLNGKMEKIQSEIDVTKLITLRNDLAFLLDNKISDIDEKIKEINFKIGTNYKIKDILNQNRKNKSHDETIKTIDDNLNFRELTSYQNNSTQKRKEMVIESERNKIDDLQDQVLVALNRLDKTGDMKIELKNELDTEKITETKTFMDKDLRDNDQKKLEINEKVYLAVKNDKEEPINTRIENNLNYPTIFSSLGNQANNTDVVTPKMTFDPLNKNPGGSLKNYLDLSKNMISESNSFPYVDIEKKNYNHNKKTPLSNILNQISPNIDHSMKSRYDEKYLSKDQNNKDKSSLSHNNINRFKFPLAFIFSKNDKEDAENKKFEKRNFFETSEERKDPLSNIANKSNRK